MSARTRLICILEVSRVLSGSAAVEEGAIVGGAQQVRAKRKMIGLSFAWRCQGKAATASQPLLTTPWRWWVRKSGHSSWCPVFDTALWHCAVVKRGSLTLPTLK
ncbi:hypothetical protein QBC47DRAFT_67887 [Echria macrotheca]|uniref:Secreted protein n=1 Tax=Echria macrotheca TaxID=438768 RepID=A0AAJ0B8L5_9PEZI|nr:hypothetical protein QBC47DRAFT_67887 [Echria macrotheca]